MLGHSLFSLVFSFSLQLSFYFVLFFKPVSCIPVGLEHCYVVEDNLILLIFLPPPPECWDYRGKPHGLVSVCWGSSRASSTFLQLSHSRSPHRCTLQPVDVQGRGGWRFLCVQCSVFSTPKQLSLLSCLPVLDVAGLGCIQRAGSPRLTARAWALSAAPPGISNDRHGELGVLEW